MFTGIIEEQGSIFGIRKGEKGAVLTIGADKVLSDTKIGDSIAVNGVCLTVTSISGSKFTADVMAETMRRTNLGDLKVNDRVNLERALSLSSRLGGHIVSGHIDGRGIIEEYRREDNAVWISISAPQNILRYIVEKGSVAIDGVSLTVAAVDEESFKVSVIPHTGEQTGLLAKRPGDTVNLENDLLAKYVEKLLGCCDGKGRKEHGQSRIDMEFLSQNGFL